jgi:hypothetical protein
MICVSPVCKLSNSHSMSTSPLSVIPDEIRVRKLGSNFITTPPPLVTWEDAAIEKGILKSVVMLMSSPVMIEPGWKGLTRKSVLSADITASDSRGERPGIVMVESTNSMGMTVPSRSVDETRIT